MLRGPTIVVATLCWSGHVLAQPCVQIRPTDPSGGLAHYDDVPNVMSYDAPGGQVRVWYATTGTHAPALSPLGMSGAPVNVEVVGDVMEDAMMGFSSLGFTPALRDGDYDPCASNGGDDRLDVYLVNFPSGADGSVGVDRCEGTLVPKCSGFVLLDHQYAGYPDFRTGVEIVGPHELFHLIQYAYDGNVDRWWAEGTAQWATKRLHPQHDDLERFLHFFFDEPKRALDSPPGGVTSGWLYATAIWAVYLDHTRGESFIRAVFEAMQATPSTTLEATAAVLAAEGASLPATFLDFAAYNAATGPRASAGAYPLGATYPEVELTPLPAMDGTVVDDRLAGFGAVYYLSTTPRRLRLEGDPEAVAATAMPLVDGKLDPSTAVALPADLAREAVVVVAGQRASKVDALYALVSEPIPEGTGGGGFGGAGGAGGGNSAAPSNDALAAEGGCAVGTSRDDRGLWGLFAIVAVALRRRAAHSEGERKSCV